MVTFILGCHEQGRRAQQSGNVPVIAELKGQALTESLNTSRPLLSRKVTLMRDDGYSIVTEHGTSPRRPGLRAAVEESDPDP